MTEKNPPEIDWSVTTWKGSRRQQHRAFLALPLARKLELVEELADLAREFQLPTAAPERPLRQRR